jgi:hypothetical protein
LEEEWEFIGGGTAFALCALVQGSLAQAKHLVFLPQGQVLALHAKNAILGFDHEVASFEISLPASGLFQIYEARDQNGSIHVGPFMKF